MAAIAVKDCQARGRDQAGTAVNPETDQTATALHGGGDQSSAASAEIKKARGRAGFSIILNLGLALLKGVAGVLAGSAALLGDAVHSATDVVGSAAAYTGLWLAGRRHPSFPYGLYKAESVGTLITAVAIILAGYEIGRNALMGVKPLPEVSLALPAALLSLVITVGFGLYQVRAGRRLHSVALVADGRDYLVDGMSTVAVIAGLVAARFGLNLDRWAAGVVALFVFWSGGQLMWRALRDLLDQAIDRQSERQIIKAVESHPSVEEVSRCFSRTAAGRFLVDLDVVLRTSSLQQAERIAARLEADICRRFPQVVLARVMPHTHQSSQIRRFTPVKGPEKDMEPHLARAPWFRLDVIDKASKKVISRQYMENPNWDQERKRGLLVGRWLLEMKPDQVVVAEKKEGTATTLLKEAGVELVLAKDLTGGS